MPRGPEKSQTEPTAANRIAAVRQASRELVRELGFLREYDATLDLTHSKGHALLELERHGRLTAVELAGILNLDKSTVSRMLSQLEKAGWVAPERRSFKHDSADKRHKPVVLSAKGRSKVRQIHLAANSKVSRALTNLSDSLSAEIVNGMSAYASALQRLRLRDEIQIRKIRRSDNPKIAAIIRQVFAEFEMAGPGYAVNDPEVDAMSENYSIRRSGYFVAVRSGEILGGAGYGPLSGGPSNTCEVRKMYLLPEARGIGMGARLLELCLKQAEAAGYTSCYLETTARLTSARKLYQKFGFKKLRRPLGATGHSAAEIYCIRPLGANSGR
jgi:putative acetyltransferase